MFGNQKSGNSAANSNPTEETVSAQPTDELVQFPADKQNEMDDDELKTFSTKDDTVWYRSKKLSVSWLLLSESCLKIKTEMKDKKRRQLMTCSVCKEYENKVIQFSANGRLPMASGIRVDGKERLKCVVDHLVSRAHEEAKRLKTHDELWKNKSSEHPWIRMFSKCQKNTLEFLLRLAVDTYNDCRAETLSARSWPSRSLSHEHSNNLVNIFESKGWDADFVAFETSSFYHYRDPVTYAEMRNIVTKLQMEKAATELKKCLCYSVQIDGSADRQQIDSKFITARFVPSNEISVQTLFLGISSSDKGGAEGLLDAFLTCLQDVGVDTEKLVGVTTDGENANTGKKGGLWKLLRDHVGRDILTAWCICHRSDLALESVQAEVPELSIWMTNALSFVSFFRTSPRRTKLLHQENRKCLKFPKHFEVRFAEHTLNLLNAVLHNLEAAEKMFQKMISGTVTSERNERSMVQGLLSKWKAGSQQLWLTVVMYDLCAIFQRIQKIFERSDLILPDIITARGAAIRNLIIMKEMPVPGGKEEHYLKNLELSGEENKSLRQTNNQFVTSMRRSDDAVRIEIEQSAINFLNERMNIEEDGTIHNLKKVLESKPAKEFIVSSRDLISQMFGDEVLEEFVGDVCASWSKISEIKDIALEDTGSIYALKLRKMAQASQGVMKQFLASILTLTPHSMATERAVSHYNNIKTVRRTSLKQETINGVMHVSLNGNGTAFYDPRPAVFEFLRKKERRNRQPCDELYKDRDFIKKFFQKENGTL